MPFKLRKAPRRELYWVVTKESGHKHSIDPLPYEQAMAQIRALYAREHGYPPLKKGAGNAYEGDFTRLSGGALPGPKSGLEFPPLVSSFMNRSSSSLVKPSVSTLVPQYVPRLMRPSRAPAPAPMPEPMLSPMPAPAFVPVPLPKHLVPKLKSRSALKKHVGGSLTKKQYDERLRIYMRQGLTRDEAVAMLAS